MGNGNNVDNATFLAALREMTRRTIPIMRRVRSATVIFCKDVSGNDWTVPERTIDHSLSLVALLSLRNGIAGVRHRVHLAWRDEADSLVCSDDDLICAATAGFSRRLIWPPPCLSLGRFCPWVNGAIPWRALRCCLLVQTGRAFSWVIFERARQQSDFLPQYRIFYLLMPPESGFRPVLSCDRAFMHTETPCKSPSTFSTTPLPTLRDIRNHIFIARI